MRIKSIFILLLMALVAFSACSRADEQSSAGETKAADFTLEALEGEKITLSELLKEKNVVLDFWTTWCPACVRSIPEIEKFYTENKDKVAVIGINIGENKEKVEKFVQQKKISYPMVLDSDSSVAKLYKVRGIPAVFAVDKDSNIIYSGHSIKEMTKKIEF